MQVFVDGALHQGRSAHALRPDPRRDLRLKSKRGQVYPSALQLAGRHLRAKQLQMSRQRAAPMKFNGAAALRAWLRVNATSLVKIAALLTMKCFALNNDSSHHASDGAITNQGNRPDSRVQKLSVLISFHQDEGRGGHHHRQYLDNDSASCSKGSTLAPHHLSITRWSHLLSRHCHRKPEFHKQICDVGRGISTFQAHTRSGTVLSPIQLYQFACQCSVGQVSDQSFCLSCLPGKHQKKGPCAGQYQNKQSRTAVMRVHPDISLHQRPSSYAIDTSCPQAPPSQHAFEYTNGELHFEQNFGQHCQQKCRE